MIIMAKNKLRNQGFQPNNNQQRNNQAPANNSQPQATVETPTEEAEVATLTDVAADVEMMDAETASDYLLTYEDMEMAHKEMSKHKVPTVYISRMMGDVLDLMEIEESEGGLIRTQDDVYAEITKMDEVAKLSNEMFGLNINLATDDTEAAKRYRALFNFKEDAPENKTEGGRIARIPKHNEEALDLIFQEWAAFTLIGYNAWYTDKQGNKQWNYNNIYTNVDAMYTPDPQG